MSSVSTTNIYGTNNAFDRPSGTGPLCIDRGRDKVGLCPSLRTGLPNFLDPALQSAVTFEKISRRILLNFKVRSVVVSRYLGGQCTLALIPRFDYFLLFFTVLIPLSIY